MASDIQKKPQVKKEIFFAIACAAIVISGLIFLIRGSTDATKNDAFVSFSGVAADAFQDISLQTPTEFVALDQNGLSFSLPPSKTSFAPPYKLKASIITAQKQYRDFLFTVNADRTVFTVLADGFRLDNSISLRVNDKTIYSDVPMDWSGRMELKAPLDQNAANVCITMENEGDILGICHVVPKRAKA